MSINRVCISGNVSRDPDPRVTPSGLTVLTLSVAVNDKYKDKYTDEWKEYTNWVDCTCFGKQADFYYDKVGKGSKVFIEGKIHYESWDDKETGKKRSKLVVYIDKMEIADPKKKPEQQSIWGSPEAQPANDGKYHGEAKLDDVPF